MVNLTGKNALSMELKKVTADISPAAPAGVVPTDAERIELYSGLSAYAGRYSIEGDLVSHDVDASWNQSWTGTVQVRQFRIDGLSICTSGRCRTRTR
jgi:hypothetical protein